MRESEAMYFEGISHVLAVGREVFETDLWLLQSRYQKVGNKKIVSGYNENILVLIDLFRIRYYLITDFMSVQKFTLTMKLFVLFQFEDTNLYLYVAVLINNQ